MKRLIMVSALSAIALSAGGCMLFGYVASAMPPMPVKAQYTGLKDQSVAIMVWTDRSLRIDFPLVQLDIANTVQAKLEQAIKDKKDDVKGVTFPVEPRSIVRYQRDNPSLASKPITDVAPDFGVSRLIYIEILSLETRPVAELELYRGKIVATVRVVEIEPDGKAKVAFTNTDLTVLFPRKGRPEGVPDATDVIMYQGVIDEFTTQVAWLFHTHTPPDDTGSGLNK